MTTLTQQSKSPTPLSSTMGESKYAGFRTAAWRRFRRNKLALFGMVYVTLIFLVAVFAPYLTNHTFEKINPQDALQTPSRTYLFGADYLGRDIYTRIIFGARPMLIVGLVTQIFGILIGTTLGLLAGYLGGVVDWFVTRLIDLFSALPWYLIVLYLVMILSPSMRNLIIAVSITSWVASCRIVRSLTLSIREQEYIEAAQALGIKSWRIVSF